MPLDPDRCFVTGFDQSGDVGSPFGNPSTNSPQFVGSVTGWRGICEERQAAECLP